MDKTSQTSCSWPHCLPDLRTPLTQTTHVITPLVMHLPLSIYVTLREDELWPAWQVCSCTNNC